MPGYLQYGFADTNPVAKAFLVVFLVAHDGILQGHLPSTVTARIYYGSSQVRNAMVAFAASHDSCSEFIVSVHTWQSRGVCTKWCPLTYNACPWTHSVGYGGIPSALLNSNKGSSCFRP